LGGGFALVTDVSATDGVSSERAPSGLLPNLEFCVRYLFL
jgi:hypothetical protein